MAAAATVLALVGQPGGAVASDAGDRATIKALTTTRGTTVTRQFFGMHAPQLDAQFPAAPVGAVDLTTNNVYWPQLELSPGVFDFTPLDAVVAQAEANHVKPLLVLGQTPAFHSLSPSSVPVAASVPDLAAWKAYVTAVVTQYGARLEYQIWPEPNVRNNFAGTPQQMADLVVAAAKIIHKKASGATVVAPAMVLRLAFQRTWMKAFFAVRVNGVRVGRYVDAVSVDPYPLQDGTPEDSLALIAKAQRILAAADVTKPLWNLEINYFVPVGGVTAAAPPTDRTSVSYVIRTYVLNAAAGVRRVYWLGWLRYFNLGISMVAEDGVTPTAAGLAFSRVRTWLLGQRARGCTYDRGTGVYACRFVHAGRSSWVYWVQGGSAKVRAPAGVRHVQTMYGDVSRTHRGQRIRVTNAPVRVYH